LSRVQIDNSYLSEKIILRKNAIEKLKKKNVLDLFCGNKLIWSNIEHDKYLGIDIKTDKNIKGDNRKYIPRLDLSIYNIIDIDAYGVPYKQIELILKNKTLDKGSIIFFTFIQTVFGAIDNSMLLRLGYSREMIKKIPTIFYKNGFDKFKKYLSVENIKNINYINIDNKYYGYFKPE